MAAAAKSKATQVELQLGEVNEEAAAAKEQAQARVQEEKQRADAAVKKHALDKDLIDRLKAEKGVSRTPPPPPSSRSVRYSE